MNICEEDLVYAVLLLDSDLLSFERVPDRHQGALPPNAPARRDSAYVEARRVLDPRQSAGKLSTLVAFFRAHNVRYEATIQRRIDAIRSDSP